MTKLDLILTYLSYIINLYLQKKIAETYYYLKEGSIQNILDSIYPKVTKTDTLFNIRFPMN